MNTHKVGDLAEARVLAALLKLHEAVLVPFGNGRPYDLVFEDVDGEFRTVQCKNGRYRDGSVVFNTVASGPRRPASGYEGIDFFGVFCPELDLTLLVPVTAVSTGKGVLRVDQPKGPNGSRLNWAEQYKI